MSTSESSHRDLPPGGSATESPQDAKLRKNARLCSDAESIEDIDAPTIAPSSPAGNEPDVATELPKVGASFDDYEIVGEIARGAMGVVYQARQKSIGRLVAIKMVLDNGADLDLLFQRFENEARVAGNLSHPNIVSVFEVGRWHGLPYFAMEFVDGGALSDMLRHDPLPPRRAAEIACQVACAIDHAHQQKVIHRDLKPANILIDQDGQTHVTDFGVSKVMESKSELTTIGELIGTPHYMPPEQAGGESAKMGPACDVYSIGAVLFAMLTGRPPFVAPTPIDVVSQVLTQEPVATRALNAWVPTELDVITHKCLQKSPGDRYASANELADDLQAYLDGQPIKARPPGIVQRTKLFFRHHVMFASISGTVALVLVAMTMLSSFALLRSRMQLAEQTELLEIAKQMRSSERVVFQQLSREASPEDRFSLFEVRRLVASAQHYQETRPDLSVTLAVAAIQTAQQDEIDLPAAAIKILQEAVSRSSVEPNLNTQSPDKTDSSEATSDTETLIPDPVKALSIGELIRQAMTLYPDQATSLDRELFGLPAIADDSQSPANQTVDSPIE